MALTIIKQPDTMSYIPYGNNIIFEFSESNMSYSEIEIVTDRSTILRFYSSPAGVVYVNLKNIIRSLVKNANLEDGSKYPEMILKATIIIRTYNRTNVLLSELQFANCIFVPRVVEYGINPYDFPNTSMMPMNPQKIVRFGNLPLYCYYMLAGEPHRIDPALVQFFDVEMRPNQCGTYLKFLNKMGGYSYWLFSDAQINESTQSYGEIYNDFMGAQETHSPVIQMGKEARKIYTCSSGMLKDYEHDIVKDIFSSPKVYLMTQGYDFQRNDGFWLEVKVTSNNVKVKDAKNKSIEYILTFEVPTTGALTL